MNNNAKKLSVITTVFNTEKFLPKCLDSVLGQSYKNLEFVVVDDCSNGNCKEIIERYKEKDDRVRYVKHDVNKGLFAARITGIKAAEGDYVAFVDSDDYVSIDYFRCLIKSMEDNDSDMAIANSVLEFDDGRRLTYNLFEANDVNLEGDEVIGEYFNQEGLDFDWHITCNKVYKKEIWLKALKHYEKQTKRLIMTEDFAFSSVLYYYAKRVTKVHNDVYFYCKHEKTATSTNKFNYAKFEKNINDMITSFNFVRDFMKDVNIYEKYKEKFIRWNSLYCKQQRGYISDAKFSKEDIEKAEVKLKEFCPEEVEVDNGDFIYLVQSKWNDKLEQIKLQICDDKTKCVSFDIFDTLLLRPFYKPSDMFIFLNTKFVEATKINTGMDFAKIRMDCEALARRKTDKDEITLDEIYDTISEQYNIDIDALRKVEAYELELEERFLSVRKTGKELFELALAVGKKVIITSDMYLPKECIEKVLKKNGYEGYSKLYLSSETFTTKSTGKLYKQILEELKITPSELVHIGDNYDSDVSVSRNLGINSLWLPRTVNVMMDSSLTNNLTSMFSEKFPFWFDTEAGIRFIGIRTMIAVCANKYFDNPFRTFNEDTDFNADPYLIGYYAMGMYVFGITRWLLDSTKNRGYKNLVFMARDGYLPMEAYQIMKKHYDNVPETKYIYVSRKALIPVTITNKLDFYKLPEVVNIYNHSPKDVIKYLQFAVNVDNEKFSELLKVNGIDENSEIGNIENYNKFIKIVIDNFYDEKAQKENLDKVRKYFLEFYEDKSATFDVGYSARPELFISNLLNKGIDTYFLNINSDEALLHAETGNFELNTFFDGKPVVTGFGYELMISALAPSCIGYDVKGDKAKPVFEDYEDDYKVKFVIEKMQNAALEFVKDMVDIFGSDLKKMYFQKYYSTLPYLAYINSARDCDKILFNVIKFEDDVRSKTKLEMFDEWKRELDRKKQKDINGLLEQEVDDIPDNVRCRGRIKRAIYYILFDRKVLKQKLRQKTENHKKVYAATTKVYSGMRKTKRGLKKIIGKD